MKILLVEDDMITRVGMGAFLKKQGDVIEAVDGLDAWGKFQTERPDLVITDLSMPNMNGTDLVGRIRETDQNVKVIVLSAADEALNIPGADKCINKPVNFKELVGTIQALVE